MINPSDGESRRRAELGAFLRLRRERVTPESAGVPRGGRRRTPGLRREEVAQLSGIGVAWYTWLEQGRRINPSVQVLDAIARTLRLDRTERDHLYRLAKVPSVPPATGDLPTAELQTILDTLTPLPASVVSARYDLVAFNEAYAALDPAIVLRPPHERNVLWHLFTIEERLQPLADWERETAFMVAQLRAESGRRLGDPHWTAFVERLATTGPRFTGMWDRHEVAASETRRKAFWTVDGAPLDVTTSAFTLATAPDTKLWIYTPADETTRERLAQTIDRYRDLGPAEMLRRGARSGGP